mmetsp:Transcript_9941/g.40252  ORF Transcript_9941/g.40252 Transcript_9941/m.40252 type:complete len:241 (-) Transcript_9941:107-829(-)
MATGQREVDDFTKQQLAELAVSLDNLDPKERKKLRMNKGTKKSGFGPIKAIKKFYRTRLAAKKGKKAHTSTYHVEYDVPTVEASEEFVVKDGRGQEHFDGAVSPPVRAKKKSKRISLLTSEQTKIKPKGKKAGGDDLFVFLEDAPPLDLGIGTPSAGDTPSVIALNTELDCLMGQAASLVNDLDNKSSPALKKAPAISKLSGKRGAGRAPRNENAPNRSPLATAPVTRRSSRRRKAMAAR